ncbi:MAG: shikimate kinase [Ruminiclostridium sp.]|nr:shikimate kinase [Ruminiclostridium sp.]
MNSKNIVLIGIMGCGKTAVGKAVAERLNLRFIDLDEYIESKWGSIPVLFEKGEEYFRDIETRALKEVSSMDGTVIATGGGVIKRAENITALKEQGTLFFLDRPLEDILDDIDTDHRPLLKDGKNKLVDLFYERYPLYVKVCDVHVRETNTLEDAINQVIREWKNQPGKKVTP